ncbi:MAG: hypothetical protein QXI58_01125 [Candidatus Micrarchaeia archaeon]
MSINTLKVSSSNTSLLEQELQNCSQNIQNLKESITKEIAKILVFVTLYTLDGEKFKFSGKYGKPDLDLEIKVQNRIIINLNLSAPLSQRRIVSVPLFSFCFSTYSRYISSNNLEKIKKKYKEQFKRKIKTLIEENLYYNSLYNSLYNKLLIPLYKEYKVSVERNFDQIVNNLASNNNIDISGVFSIII